MTANASLSRFGRLVAAAGVAWGLAMPAACCRPEAKGGEGSRSTPSEAASVAALGGGPAASLSESAGAGLPPPPSSAGPPTGARAGDDWSGVYGGELVLVLGRRTGLYA